MQVNFRHIFARWSYTFLMLLLLPLLGWWLWRQKSASCVGHDAELKQRLGLGIIPQSTGGWLLHCASVGEVVAASRLINTLLAQQPGLNIAVTTASATGGQRVKQLFGDRVSHYYLPVDLPWCMASLLKQLEPEKLVIIEVELWPNLLYQCAARQIPVYIVNARMTEASLLRMQRFSWLFQPLLDSLYAVGAQGKRDYHHYLQAGIGQEKLFLTGNIKFDLQLGDDDRQRAEQLIRQFNLCQRPILIAGSTHEPEEHIILDAYRQLKQTIPDLLLILVPRHPQRFDSVYQLCQRENWHVTRSSLQQAASKETDIFLADSMGILKYLYAAADVAFIGGSIAPRGGHNPLEAAIWSIPVLMGNSQYNNPEICSLLIQQQGMQVIKDSAGLAGVVRGWLEHNELRQEWGLHAHQVIADNSGAVFSSLEMLQS